MGRRDSWTPAERAALHNARERDLLHSRPISQSVLERNNMAEATNTTPETQAAAHEVKLTRREKLAAAYQKKRAQFDKLNTELVDIVNEITAIDALANVAVGTAVIISIGKGETAAEVQGTVIGVKEDEEGAKLYKVAYGSGFDADVKIVGSSRLKLVTAQAEIEGPAAE